MGHRSPAKRTCRILDAVASLRGKLLQCIVISDSNSNRNSDSNSNSLIVILIVIVK